jgi:polyisoprenoid-binding protein YceI
MSAVAEQSTTLIPAGEWAIDPVWSSLEFEVKKLGLMTVKGRVPGFTGTITGGEAPSIEGAVDATSITTFDETGRYLQSWTAGTARYPGSASSQCDRAHRAGRRQGHLTIKGTTKPVTLTGRFIAQAPTRGAATASDRSAPSTARTSGSVERTASPAASCSPTTSS